MAKKVKVDPRYKKTIEQIRLDSENDAEDDMQGVYQLQNDKLDEVHNLIGKIFIAYAVNGLLNLQGKQKTSILSNVKSKLTDIGKDLANNEVDKVGRILSQTYEDTYNKNNFVFDQLGITSNFNILKKEFIDTAINREYKDSTFSDRIWKNKSDMMDTLYNLIKTASTDNKTTIDQIGKQIKDKFGVQAFESRRLVRTEVARNATDAQLLAGKNAGCKTVCWNATLDNRTAEYDASLDGQTWGIDEDHPMPVSDTHPNCRCVLLNLPYENWTPSKRLDNDSRELIDWTNYADWKAQQNNDNSDDGTDN